MTLKTDSTIPAPPPRGVPEFELTFQPSYVSRDESDVSLAEEIMRAFRGKSADATYEPTGEESKP